MSSGGDCFKICSGCSGAEGEAVVVEIPYDDGEESIYDAFDARPVLSEDEYEVVDDGDDVDDSGCQGDGGQAMTARDSRQSTDSAGNVISRITSMGARSSDGGAFQAQVSVGRLADSLKKSASLAEEFNPQIIELLSFDGCEELLRGSNFTTIMHKAAKIFQNAAGSAKTFDMSHPVKEIHTFVSHNWCVPRWMKFFCLAVNFNFEVAFVAKIVAIAVLATATVLGYLPTINSVYREYPVGIVGKFMIGPVYLFILSAKHELHRILGAIKDKPVFLDKVCIHQTDKEIQKRGISKLGAYLCNSQHMMVVYTDLYLQKLWTIYEVACFLSLHPVKKMIIIPTFFPIFFFAVPAIHFVQAIQFTTCLYMGWNFISVYLVGYLSLAGGSALARRWARELVSIKKRLETFDVHNCICFCEDDRPFVYENIGLFMRAIQAVPEDSSTEEALQAFNSLVQGKVATAFNYSVGEVNLGYLGTLCTSSAIYGGAFLDEFAGISYGSVCITRLLNTGGLWLLMAPLIWRLLCIIAGKCLHIREKSVGEYLYILSTPIIPLMSITFYDVWMKYWGAKVIETGSKMAFGVMVVTLVLVALIVVYLFNRSRKPPTFKEVSLVGVRTWRSLSRVPSTASRSRNGSGNSMTSNNSVSPSSRNSSGRISSTMNSSTRTSRVIEDTRVSI